MLRNASRLRSTARLTPPVRGYATATETAQAGGRRLRSALLSSALTLGTVGFLYYTHDASAGFNKYIALPAVLAYTQDDPEKAHKLAVTVIGSGIAPVDRGVDDEVLETELFGRKYSNPLGIAAGFDKHAEAIDGLYDLGFGYVEIGSVTPKPQDGNPKPRVFRIPETKSVVNRYGFNSDGHDAVLARLRHRVSSYIRSIAPALPSSLFPPQPELALPSHDVVADLLNSPDGQDAKVVDRLELPRSLREGRVLGVNLGKNKVSKEDSIEDFVVGVQRLGPLADVLVINVSSPNTPGLRGMQRKGVLEELLSGVVAARDALPGQVKPPVLVKIAPDNDAEQLRDIAGAVVASKIDGIVVSNTTISRPASAGNPQILAEAGGLSGPPVKPLALKALETLYKETDGKVPLIGCGGISSGQDALDFAKAGASLVQLYTGFVYGGFGLPREIKNELAELLRKEGKTWREVIGTGKPKLEAAPTSATTPAATAAAVSAQVIGSGATGKGPSIGEQQEKLAEETKPQRAVPRLSDKQFEKELHEAKDQLEFLLAQLDKADLPKPAKGDKTLAATEAVKAASEGVKVEASKEGIALPPVTGAIDTTPVAVPAQALLDEKSIFTMLDPAKAQVEAGIAQPVPKGEPVKAKVEEKKEEAKLSLTAGKRWV